MTRDEFDAICKGFKAATNVVQWGGCSVWKVGGKIFALCSPVDKGEHFAKISFKCSEIAYEILREEPGHHPGAAPCSGQMGSTHRA